MQNRQSLYNLLEKMLSVLESKEQKGSVAGPSKRQRKPLGSKGREASGETDESFWNFDFISRFGVGVMFIIGYAVHCKMYKMYKRI